MSTRSVLRQGFSALAIPVMLVVAVGCGRRVYPTAPTLATVAPTASATATAPATPTATLTPYVSPTSDPALLESTARALMATPEFARAIPLWDEILQLQPTYGEGYFQRGRAYLGLLDGETFLDAYVEYGLSSLADLDRSIALGPVVDGRNFYRRFQALMSLAGVEPYRVNRERLYRAALENLRVSNSIGPWNTSSESEEGLVLVQLGECAEAQALGERLLREYTDYFRDDPDQGAVLALVWRVLAGAATCSGRPEDAVDFVARALEMDPPASDHWTWILERALNLYYLGRSEEALSVISEDIQAFPYYSAERYFLRALILLDLGREEEARGDLDFGATQTWFPVGQYYYALGRIALREGDIDEGIQALQMAEATLGREYGPLLERARQYLADMGAEPLGGLDSAEFAATAIPTLTPSPTPRIPILPGTPAYYDAHVVDMSVGTGPLMIRPHQDFVYCFRFQAEVPVDPDSVVDLTFRLIPYLTVVGGPSGLEVQFLTSERGILSVSNRWGDNRVYEPSRHLRDDGEVMLILDNPGELPIYLQDVGMRLVSRRPDGSYLILGPGSAPHLESLPEGGVNRTVVMPGSTGPMSLGPNGSQIIHFTPPEPIDYAGVESVRFRVVSADSGEPSLLLMIWSPWSGGWGGTEEVDSGLFEASTPAMAVDADGDIVVEVHNLTNSSVDLADVSVEAVLQTPDGNGLTLGGLE